MNPAVIAAVVGGMCLSSSIGAALMMGGGEEDDGTGGANNQNDDEDDDEDDIVLPQVRYVRVERPSANYPANIINLGELEVFDTAGTNIALNATVTGGPGGAHSAGPYERLTDGNFGNFAHTTGDGVSFMEIDLGAIKEIAKIVITNRPDCCQDRLTDATLKLLDGSKAVVKTTAAIVSDKMKLTYDFNVTTPAWEYTDA
jgi:hypothetical protein